MPQTPRRLPSEEWALLLVFSFGDFHSPGIFQPALDLIQLLANFLLTLPLNTLDPTFPAWMLVITSQLASQLLIALLASLNLSFKGLGMLHIYLLVLLLFKTALGILSFRKLSLSLFLGWARHPGMFLCHRALIPILS